ncbi:MAG: threonine synthase [Bacteroidales bacterium]|jgi:threonine synthase|nr:threonine synthase [Bacteroidales bacterium]
MLYHSTSKKAPAASLQEAVTRGLAPDGGLYMPEQTGRLGDDFFKRMYDMDLQEIALEVAVHFLGGDVPTGDLKRMICDTLDFPVPLVHIHDKLYTLELFHGPTMAFKDIGARFMARLLGYFTSRDRQELNVLAATSGDTGSAVANGFYKLPGIRVFVLYPKGLVSSIQEKQFTTLGENITAIEVEGTFDDCQAMVKRAFADEELNRRMKLTSANSINWARLLPQSFYYFWGVAQMGRSADDIVCAVPSGNFGNICAGLIAKRLGLPIVHFIAATNINDIVPQYLQTGRFNPRSSVATIANAMDVGKPSNFARIAELYDHSHQDISSDVEGFVCTDRQILATIKEVYANRKYLLDPHGAIGYRALKSYLDGHPSETGFFIETAHPAKFTEAVKNATGEDVALPPNLARFADGKKQTVELPATFDALKNYLNSEKR